MFTGFGRLQLVVVLSPNWPLSLSPQAASVPSVAKATLKRVPALVRTTVLPANAPPITGTGRRMVSNVVPLPNSP